MVWYLETIRATVLAPDIKALGLLKWQELVGGSQPERLNPAPNTFLEQGFAEGFALTIGEQPGRADLIAAARQLPTALFPAILGDLANFLPKFMKITKRWLSGSGSVKRLDVFSTIFEGAGTPDDALEALLPKIPSFKREPGEEIRDLFLQINRPRQSKTDPSKQINRFVQWSARIITIMAYPGMLRPPVFPRYPRAQADIDINTAEGSDIPNSLIAQYLDEMALLMLEIAQNGDTP